MSEEPQYNRQTLGEISKLFDEAERAIKYVEDFDGVLTVPAVNQLRYSGNHLVRYLTEADPDELRDALKHVKRSHLYGQVNIRNTFRRSLLKVNCIPDTFTP